MAPTSTASPPAWPRPVRLAGWLYLVGLHLLLAVLVFKTDFIPRIYYTFGWLPAGPDLCRERLQMFHERVDATVPEGAAIFLGDSLTQGLAVAAVAPVAVNYGIGGLTSAQLLDALPHFQALGRARIVFLSIGINDLLLGREGALPQRYAEILAALPPDVPLVWSTLLPAGLAPERRAAITQANQAIRTLCAARPGCRLVDATPALAGPDGRPRPGMMEPDGLHLAPAGNRAWIEALRAAAS